MKQKKDNSHRPIGVFDSGVGGLTVLCALMKKFPHENFYYIADQAYCPYGVKTREEIAARVETIVRHLDGQGVKAVVIACNTATMCIDTARAATGVPVMGVIEPACAEAIRVTRNQRVAVLATQATIDGGLYQKQLRDAGVEPVPLACGEFVDFIEKGDPDASGGLELVEEKLAGLRGADVDTVIHACTHFGLLERHMRKVLGDNIRYVSCGEPASRALEVVLLEKGLLCPDTGKGVVEIFTTGERKKAVASMSWFKAPHKPVRHIEILQQES